MGVRGGFCFSAGRQAFQPDGLRGDAAFHPHLRHGESRIYAGDKYELAVAAATAEKEGEVGAGVCVWEG